MDETLRLIGGIVWLVVALAGTVAGWMAISRMRRWRFEQTALLPVLHADMVETRREVLRQAFALESQIDLATGRVTAAAQDLAAMLLGKGFAWMTGKRAGIWGTLAARVLAGKVGSGLESVIGLSGDVSREGSHGGRT